MKLTLDGTTFDVEVEEGAVTVNGKRYTVSLAGDGKRRTAIVNGRTVAVDLGVAGEDGAARQVNADGKIWAVTVSGQGAAAAPSPAQAGSGAAGGSSGTPRAARSSRGAITAQMTGRVLAVNVQPGDSVQEGQPLLMLEAMKMENEIRAPRAGTVKSVAVNVGDRVNTGDTLVELED